MQSGSLTRRCKLHDVFYVPDLAYSLLSVSKAVERGITFNFSETGCIVRDTTQRLATAAQKVGNLYQVPNVANDCVCTVTEDQPKTEQSSSKEEIWHRRYCHLGVQNLQKLARDGLVEQFDYCATIVIPFCEPCLKGKHHRSPFPLSSQKRASKPLELIHTDVCGKLSSKSFGGAEYFVTFTDDKTRYVWVYVMKKKSEVFERFCEWKSEVEKSLGQSVKVLRSDNGGEYTSDEFKKYLKVQGIKHEFTIPKNPEQNGVAERLNRTLVEMVRSMLADSRLPKSFWAEALATAVYVRNRCPTVAVERLTPFESLNGVKPKVGHLKVFGCAAYPHIPKDERKKLDDKTHKCIFLGYSDNRKGYRLYDLNHSKVIHSRDIKFNELDNGFEKENSSSATSQVIVDCSNGESCAQENEKTADESETRLEPILRRSQRETRKPDYYGEWANSATMISEPNTVTEALKCPERKYWKEAMTAEIQSLHKNQVWDLVPPPKDCKVVGSKWVFKCKLGENGLVERFKARVVAQGYSQRAGIDYEETFSPVVRFESVRSVIALATQERMQIHQMDVKTAFLNGELDEEVFMCQPEGAVEEGKENFVCHLKKSIYGLKQSPRCWNTVLDDHLKKMNFVQTKGDPCLYVSKDATEPAIIAVYVDDILIAARSDEKIAEVKCAIADQFEAKDMGELHYFLGVKIVRDRSVFIWIKQYSILKQMNNDCKTIFLYLEKAIQCCKNNFQFSIVIKSNLLFCVQFVIV